jgi:hypothetical protein
MSTERYFKLTYRAKGATPLRPLEVGVTDAPQPCRVTCCAS